MTRRERLKVLIEQVDELADEIERTGREDEVLSLANRIREHPDSVVPLDEIEWGTLLPKERESRLVERYLTLRSELVTLEREGRKTAGQKRRSWLDGPAPKVVSLLVGVGELVQYGAELLHVAGIMAHEEGELDAFGDSAGTGDELA